MSKSGISGSSRRDCETSSYFHSFLNKDNERRHGLRCASDQGVSGSGRAHLDESDNARGRQHGVPKHYEQNRARSKKKALSSSLPPTAPATSADAPAIIGSAVPNGSTGHLDIHLPTAFASGEQNHTCHHHSSRTTSTRFDPAMHGRRNPRGSPFCPCFSRNISEDELSVNGMQLSAERTAVSAEASPVAAASTVPSSHSERHLPSHHQGAQVDAADVVTDAEASARPPMPRRLTNTWDSVLRAASQFGSLLVSALSTGEPLPAAPNRVFARSSGSVSESAHGQLISIDEFNARRAVHTTVEYNNVLVPDMVGILSAAYYWGTMDRYEAERLLEGKPEGTFLLRDSAQINYLFSVSFRRYDRTLHARIEHLDGKFSFDIHDSSVFTANKITELIENYKDPSRCLFYEPQLSTPLCRNFVFSLQQLCRAAIASTCTFESVADLPLPPAQKKFLREYHYKQPVRVTEHV